LGGGESRPLFGHFLGGRFVWPGNLLFQPRKIKETTLQKKSYEMISLYLDDVVFEFYVLLSPDSSLFYLKVLDCLYIYSFILVSAYWLLFRLTEA